MKAAFIKKTGGPEEIQWGELPTPTPKDNEVLVKVSAVAVNPVDTYIRAGKFPLAKPLSMPYIIGSDMVGTVSKTGKNATQFKAGEKVWSNSLGRDGRQGSFAEYVIVDKDLLYPAPADVDDKILVSFLQAGATASLGLVREAMLKTSDIIFVNGGGGNIGSAVIQLAKERGAKVITSSSSKEKLEWCKSIGADLVLDYKTDNMEEKIKKFAPEGVNVFWDTSRTPNFDLAVPLLAKKGRIILMAGAEAHPPFPVGPFYRKECSMRGFNLNLASPQELLQCADIINVSLLNNKIQSKIAQVMPLSDAAEAHKMIESKPEVWGKIVLTA